MVIGERKPVLIESGTPASFIPVNSKTALVKTKPEGGAIGESASVLGMYCNQPIPLAAPEGMVTLTLPSGATRVELVVGAKASKAPPTGTSTGGVDAHAVE